MFVILVNYIKPLSEIDALLEDHRRFLDEGYAAGYFLASGPRVPRTGGVILAHATSAQELKVFIAKDSFNRAGAATYEVVEFTAVKFDPRLQQVVK